ncbi:MAG: phosphatidate cytidylyltransferase [Pseudomarimonas sp.]
MITALVMAPLAIALILMAPTVWFMAVLTIALLLGLWEWTRLIDIRTRPARAAVLLLNIGLMAMLALHGWPQAFMVVTAVGAASWLLVCLWLFQPRFASSPAGQPLKLLAGSMMIIPTWCAIALLHADAPLGPGWALFGLMLVWAADTFAYFAGSRIGGPKLAPRISPGKTWAGFWGGLVGACVICVPAVPLLGLAWSRLPVLMGLALVVALASVVGDLFESLIKRQAGAKDSGTLIPGHGGVLDRIDSVVAALPVFVVGKLLLGL